MSQGIEVVSPVGTGQQAPADGTQPQRAVGGARESADAPSLVLFSNNKPNVAPFFADLHQRFAERHPATEIALMGKPGASTPAEPVVLDDAAGYLVAVAAIGD